ncbi:MAG: enoyl-CoA hydratase [Burkholderiaceae bacterium]|jgi:enoyl-CoA hydratase/carnithine racemase
MDIETAVSAGIMQIEFNRPEKKNAITSAMYQALADSLTSAQSNPDVRVVVLCGKPEVFTAGNDLDDFLNQPPQSTKSPVFQFLEAISHAEKPLIAAVCGAAVGVGTTLLLHCDLVYAGENARFRLPFASLGLVPEAASSLLLPQLVGYQKAAEYLLLGEVFDAHEAYSVGLVNRVLPPAEVLEFARSQAAKLVGQPAAALRATKRLMRRAKTRSIEEQMATESEEFRARLDSPEAREAFTAFFERRKPDFKRFA